VKNHSPFAKSLRALLDESGVLARREWAQVLRVSTAAISQWVNDRTIPEPENLRSIVRIVSSSDRTRPELLERFNEVISAPAGQVSPHGLRAGRSFADYMTRPLFSTFERMWNGLTPSMKETVLADAVELCSRAFEAEQSLADGGIQGAWSLKGFLDALSRLPARQREQVLVDATALCARIDTSHSHSEENAETPKLRLLAGLLPATAGPPELMAGAAQPSFPNSHSVVVCDGISLEDALRSGPRSIGAVRDGALRAPEYEFFELRRSGNDDSRRRIAIWTVPTNRRYGSLKVNELFAYVLKGAIQYRFTPSREWIELDAGSQRQVLWIRSPGAERGIPPFEVRVVGREKPVVLAVFYCKEGVEVQTDLSGNWFRPQETGWSDVPESPSHDATLLITGEIPREAAKLAEFVSDNPIREYGYVHDGARRNHQLRDADPPWWQTDRSALNLRVLQFPRPAPDQKEDAVWLDSHAGEEVIVPLQGKFECVFVDLAEGETEFRDGQCDKFAKERWRHREAESASERKTPFVEEPLPGIMLLKSSCAHGFFATGDRECYALHVRILPPSHESSSGGETAPTSEQWIYPEPRAVNQ
jgi:hypothetical protein